MKIVCIHCGGEFSIRAEDLGGSGYCPHCRGQIALPKPSSRTPEEEAPPRGRPLAWLDSSISGLASLVIHMAIFLIVALWQAGGGEGGAGEGEEVLIGLLPTQELSETQETQLSAGEVQREQSADLETMIEVEAPTTAATSAADGEISLSTPSPSGGEAGGFDLGAVAIGGGSMGGGGSFEGMIGQLRRNGLDIVLCFDSTGSMAGEITQVKRQIQRIGQTLTTLVPKARISVCTYRDEGDEYVTKGLPLTGSIQEVSSYLDRISAGGGGDHPEAVDEGLYWSVSQNNFRPNARKVILLFGDAPPHPDKLKRALEVAGNFRSQSKGIVSTITCQSNTPMPEFYEIAAAGGGEAFLTTDQKQIMTQLMVLVFGSRHRDKVLEAFKLLEE